METTHLHIKNMVCPRCIYIVNDELQSLGISIEHIELRYAKVSIPENVTLSDIDKKLNQFGFKLICDKEEILIEHIHNKIVEYILLIENGKAKKTLSAYLADQLNHNYNSLSKAFSHHENMTIENRYIDLKIERVKELLEDGDMNISEIARRLGYSSVHYLSNQFKQWTGATPSRWKKRFIKKLNGIH